MSATNSTANYSLPIFVSSDVPSWLTDWNGAMGDIDTAIAAAKAVADSALLASGNNSSDITTINGQITSLQTTVGTHTTQIGTISGNINTINSLIGNGTPTTTDQTIIGAINELHADQGDLNDLTTSDKTSLVNAINEAAQSGGGGIVYQSMNITAATTFADIDTQCQASIADGKIPHVVCEYTHGGNVYHNVCATMVQSGYDSTQTYAFSACRTTSEVREILVTTTGVTVGTGDTLGTAKLYY